MGRDGDVTIIFGEYVTIQLKPAIAVEQNEVALRVNRVKRRNQIAAVVQHNRTGREYFQLLSIHGPQLGDIVRDPLTIDIEAQRNPAASGHHSSELHLPGILYPDRMISCIGRGQSAGQDHIATACIEQDAANSARALVGITTTGINHRSSGLADADGVQGDQPTVRRYVEGC